MGQNVSNAEVGTTRASYGPSPSNRQIIPWVVAGGGVRGQPCTLAYARFEVTYVIQHKGPTLKHQKAIHDFPIPLNTKFCFTQIDAAYRWPTISWLFLLFC